MEAWYENALTMFVAAIVVLSMSKPAKTQSDVVVPSGNPVMVDGKLSSDEWKDAAKLDVASGAHLYLKLAGRFLCLALELPAGQSGFTDLYLALASGAMYDLHASAKLGQRKLQKGKWPEWQIWWNNEGWIANVSRVNSFDKRTFLPTNVREYQIDRAKFPGDWSIEIEFSIESRSSHDYSVIRWPAGADDRHPKQWLQIHFPHVPREGALPCSAGLQKTKS